MSKFFDYFQIVYLAFFLFVFIGRILYLRFKKNINPIKLGVGKKGLNLIVELSFFVGLTVWVVTVLLYAFHIEFLLFPTFLNIQLVDSTLIKFIGVGLLIIAFIIFIWALGSFGDSYRIGIDEKTKGELITTGVFTVSRNPIFIFIDIYFAGTFMINGALIFLIFTVVVVISLHYQIIQEEKFLSKAYGQAYQDYCDRTKRYFGWRRKIHSGNYSILL